MKGMVFTQIHQIILIFAIAAATIFIILSLKYVFENTPDIFAALATLLRFW